MDSTSGKRTFLTGRMIAISLVLLFCGTGEPLYSQTMRAADENDPGSKMFFAGAAIGSPSSIAIVGGASFGRVLVRASGGSWGNHWDGIQGEIGFRVSCIAALTQSLAVVAGHYRTNVTSQDTRGKPIALLNEERYYALAYDVDYAGFILQLGFASGNGDFPNPQLLWQAGYVFHF